MLRRAWDNWWWWWWWWWWWLCGKCWSLECVELCCFTLCKTMALCSNKDNSAVTLHDTAWSVG